MSRVATTYIIKWLYFRAPSYCTYTILAAVANVLPTVGLARIIVLEPTIWWGGGGALLSVFQACPSAQMYHQF